jgi:hypothetical protein
MSRRDVDDRERRTMSLLIQLFGREVVEQLSLAGFDSSDAISRAGAEGLAQQGGIPLPLARRIVAVAAEARISDAEVRQEAVSPAPAPAAPPAKRTRRSAGGPAGGRSSREREPAQAPAPEPAIDTAIGMATATDDATDSLAADEPPLEPEGRLPDGESDPFVDDAGLVSWLGFALAPGVQQSASFPVADAILDPARPAIVTQKVAAPASQEAELPRTPENPVEARPQGASFWSFGLLPTHAQGDKRPAPEKASTNRREQDRRQGGPGQLAAHPIYRRRAHDGH